MDDEDELALAMAMSLRPPSRQPSIDSRKEALQQVEEAPPTTLKTLSKLLSNIAEHPDEPKYKMLPRTSRGLNERVFPIKAATAFLVACGFDEEKEGFILKQGHDRSLIHAGLERLEELSAGAAVSPTRVPAPPALAAPVPPTPVSVSDLAETITGMMGPPSRSAGGGGASTPAAREMEVWRRQQAQNSMGFIFEAGCPHPDLEPGTRVLDLDENAAGTLLGWKHQGTRYHDTSGGLSSDGCCRIYYDTRPAKHDGNPWNVMARDSSIIFLDAAAPDPPATTLERVRPRGGGEQSAGSALGGLGNLGGLGGLGGLGVPSSGGNDQERTQQSAMAEQKQQLRHIMQVSQTSAIGEILRSPCDPAATPPHPTLQPPPPSLSAEAPHPLLTPLPAPSAADPPPCPLRC
jgi:hypothetical protein